ncbi:MAG: TonB-dependent receptor plug domain-containing protein [Rhodothermales bacterium]
MYRGLLFLLFFLLLSQPTGAQTTPDTTVALPNVTVVATRLKASLVAVPVRVTLLDPEAISSTGARSVADLLSVRSPFFIKRHGDGQLASLSLRGTGASQTLLLLDGHRMADPQLGQLDLSLLPTLLLESVEVMGGAGSPLYGTDGLGGVVNLRTSRPGTGRVVKVQGGYGAYGERRGGLLVSGNRGAFSGLALVGYETAAGDYPYLNKGLFPPDEVPREGADRTRLSIYSSLAYRTSRSRLRVATWYNDAERGLPTIGSTRQRGERQWDEHLRLWADGEHRFAWGTLRIGGIAQQGALRYRNEQLKLDETGRTFTSSLDVEAQGLLGTRWLLAGGVAGGYGAVRHPSLQGDASETHAGAFLHGTGSYGRLLVYPALRLDVYFRPDAGALRAVNPRLGINVRLLRGVALHVKGNVGRAFRVPTFNDRFWQPGGKPDLKPEQGWTYDAGVLLEHRNGLAEVTLFLTHIRDQIVWLPTPAGYYAPDNVQQVRSRGLEASYRRRWQPASWLRLDGSLFYTLTDARDRSDPASSSYGQPLRHVPRHQVKSHLGVRVGPVHLDLSGRYLGRRYTTTDGSASLDPFFLFDAQLRFHGHTSLFDATLAVFVENLADRRYEVIQNNPMPPRHARLLLTLVFQ